MTYNGTLVEHLLRHKTCFLVLGGSDGLISDGIILLAVSVYLCTHLQSIALRKWS